MQIPTLENSPTSVIHLIGGEKGGVGKSMVSRVLAQYFIDREWPFVGFDTDRSHGSLRRFYADFASEALVDQYEALDRIVEAALARAGVRVLVDLAAQTHEPLVKWMDESGVLDMGNLSGFTLKYWHVMDSGRDSIDLLAKLFDRFGHRVHYVIVRNHLRGSDFSLLEKSGLLERAGPLGAKVIDLKQLHGPLVQKIDARNSSFWAAKNTAPGASGPLLNIMERQRLKLWLNHAYGEVEKAGP
jgi:hypothetical protein